MRNDVYHLLHTPATHTHTVLCLPSLPTSGCHWRILVTLVLWKLRLKPDIPVQAITVSAAVLGKYQRTHYQSRFQVVVFPPVRSGVPVLGILTSTWWYWCSELGCPGRCMVGFHTMIGQHRMWHLFIAFSSFLYLLLLFETGFLCVALAVLELSL